jgi:type IV pilus assembly protein PilM
MSLPKFFGLDIGNHSIKAIRLSDSSESPKLLGYAYGTTPMGILMSESEENQKRLSDSIRDIIKSSNLSDVKKVVFAVPESHVYRRFMRLPYVDDESLNKAVYWEVQKYLTTPIDDVRLGIIFIGERIENDTRVADVLAIAVNNKHLDRYMRVLDMAGLEPIGAETEAIAAVRAISHLALDIPSSSYLIVDFGSQSTDVSVAYKDKLIYSDSIAYGSDSITKAISQSFSMDSSKANEYKKTYGMDPKNFQGKLATVINPVVDIILVDVKRTLEYFRREFTDIAPAKVFLTGEASLMPGFVEYVAQKLQITVEIANPWKDIKVSENDASFLEKSRSAYTVAIGLSKKNDFE